MTATIQEVTESSIAEMRGMIDGGELSARELAEQHLDRIERLDERVNAVIEINPDALESADTADRDLAAGRKAGPLHGIPVMIKDNINTADRMTTTAGSLALLGARPDRDAAVAARLRAAGAVILGKTNLSEWANFRSARSSSGWSSRGGQTRNPYALDRSPGGSSSGSGVAVAAGFCAAAIGTETDGSIVSPASMNSIVGIKPTVGLVSRSGIIPISHSQDTAGPMARSVADAALVLSALAGSDPEDPATHDADRRRAADYTAFLDKGGLRGARIGCLTGLAETHEGIAAILEANLTALREAGAEVVHRIALPPAEDVRPAEMLVMTTEFKAGMNRYLAAFGPDTGPDSLEALMAFNECHRDRIMPYYPQDLFERAQATKGLDDPAYQEARRTCLRLVRDEGLDKVMAEQRLDALVVPTTCAPWLIDWVNGDNRSGSSAYLAAVSGYPSITVPAGYYFGLPIGLSFIAGAYQEGALIRFAYAFEQATQVRVPPRFAASAAL
ncbi:amidase [Pelagibius sp.]|uniref:amidase n=1 Tax=Pelagibius sp. TaxID=1931238 RepID=UPI002627C0D2|nr:amidase [Pelagibius sp.]